MESPPPARPTVTPDGQLVAQVVAPVRARPASGAQP